MIERHLDLLQKHRELQKAFDDTLEMNRKLGSENWKFEKENEQLKKKILYLEDNLRVAKKDSEDLRNDIANGLKEFTKKLPFTSLRLLANKQLKENIKNARKKLFDILTDYEIANYDSNIHQFYEDVYNVHNELMELTE